MEHIPNGRFFASEFKNFVLGGQDGVVNVFGLVMGVAAGTNDTKSILIAGMACAVAESISMAAVAYTSTKTAKRYYDSERERELRYIRDEPQVERREVRDIYERKGFRGPLLSSIVRHITSDKRLWADTMMADELQLSKTGVENPGRSALIVGTAALFGSLIPVIPFFLLTPSEALLPVAVICTTVLFAAGALGAKITVGKWWKNGLEMAGIGMAAAITGYLIGWWLGVTL
jgi:VIT1/CCC1 family predicted Fe2+/Mn2+ transporter